MKNKTVLRKCLGCGQLKDRTSLMRILKDHKTGEIIISPDVKTFGRSSYLCYNKDCLKVVLKKKSFQKSFKKNLSDNFLEQLNKLLNI